MIVIEVNPGALRPASFVFPVDLTSPLTPVVLHAKQLAVGRCGFAAIMPRRDVVSLLRLKLEVFDNPSGRCPPDAHEPRAAWQG